MSPRSTRRVVVSAERALVMAAFDRELAQRLDVIDTMNTLCDRLAGQLRPWMGDAGWHALLMRSLAEVGHGDTLPLVLDADAHLRWTALGGAGLARQACIEVLAGIVRALSRFVGATLALRLIEPGLAPRDASNEGNDHG